ncbi:MAG: PKD domain-containing protein, partial [Bacteroidia bacterium]|nr:PKD domain-containing protein [Bacteroidia bacterium]
MKTKTGISILGVFMLISNLTPAQLTADFSANVTIGCSPVLVQFTDLSTGATSWQWYFGNGNSSSNQHPQATYGNPGAYDVTLIISDGTTSDTIIKYDYITVLANPVPGFVSLSGTTGCTPFEVQFQDQSSGDTTITAWLWDFGDGAISNEQNPVHSFLTAGDFTVSLQVTDAKGCDSAFAIQNYIHVTETPVANFSMPEIITCSPPVPVTFTNLSSGTGSLNYLWYFGDDDSSTLFSPVHIYSGYGEFTVSLIVSTDNNCSDTSIQSGNITISNVTASFTTTSQIYCPGQTIQFTNTSTGASDYLWNFGDSDTSTATNPTHQYGTPGTYIVTLVATIEGDTCTDTYTKTITIEQITANFSASPRYGCDLPFSAQFTNLSTSNAVSWEWNFGNGTTSTLQNPMGLFTYSDSLANYDRDHFNVTLKVTSAQGCSNTIVKYGYIYINLPKNRYQALPPQGCAPLNVNFIDNSIYNSAIDSITGWYWDFGDGNTSNSPVASNTYTLTGIYSVSHTITTALGCDSTVNFTIRAGSKPDAGFLFSDSITCLSDPVSFNDTSFDSDLVNEWFWYFSDGSASGAPNPVISFNDTGFISLVYYVGYNGCYDTLIADSLIYVKGPYSNITFNYSCAAPLTYTFFGDFIDAQRWYWYFGDGTADSTQNDTVIHAFSASGDYQPVLKAFNDTNGCSYSDSISFNVRNVQADFTMDNNTGCPFHTVNFDGSISQDERTNFYVWTWGDGQMDTLTQPFASHTYIFPNTYHPKLLVYDINGCPDNITKTVKIYLPQANFQADATIGCMPLTVNFTDLTVSDTTIVNWDWTFGDGGSSSLVANPTHIYTQRGSYS